jgi:hypothetical protein
MVTIGKLSYSWYLWHWPLLAIARAAFPGQYMLWRDLALVLVALLLSAVTYRFVEEPVRRRKPWPFKRAGKSVVVGIGLMAMTAGLAALIWGSAERRAANDPVLRAAARALSEKAEIPLGCVNFEFKFAGLAPKEKCALGGVEGTSILLLLWGDSHAFHYLPGMVRWAETHGARVLPRAAGGCKPHVVQIPDDLPANARAGAENCVAFNAAVRASLAELKAAGATTVVLAARWSVPGPLQDGLGNWEAELRNLVSFIRAAKLEVVLFAETPGRQHSVPQCVARYGPEACSRGRAEVEAERAAAVAVLRGMARELGGVRVWDPINEVCTHEICPAMREGEVLYSDDSHLSIAGSRMLAPAIGRIMGSTH